MLIKISDPDCASFPYLIEDVEEQSPMCGRAVSKSTIHRDKIKEDIKDRAEPCVVK